uniref:DNA pilot protein n=2 Tax=unclassified Microvirus TaxID=338099 RepID=A0AAU8B1Q4_9VIRU
MDPLVGSAFVSGISGLLGSGISGGMSKRAAKAYNKGQKEIAQMNNEWNAQQAAINREWQTSERDAQNQWTLEQWNRENEYNSPVAQRARLEEAGYNPYMNGLDGNTAGTGVTSAGVSGVGNPTAEMPNQVPSAFSMDFSSIGNAINSYYQNQLLANQAKGKDIENTFDFQFGSDFRKAQIASLIDGRFEFLNPSYRNLRDLYAPQQAITDLSKSRQELAGLRTQTQLTAAQAFLTGLQGKAQEIMNKYLPAQQQMQLYSYSANLFSQYAQGLLSLTTIKNRLAEYNESLARTRGLNISNEQSEKLSEYFIRAMKEEYQANAAYYRSYKSIAGAVAAARGNMDIYDSQLTRLQKNMQELFAKREDHSLMNRRAYFRAQQIWRDFVGGIMSGAAAGTGVGVMTNFPRSSRKTVKGFGY